MSGRQQAGKAKFRVEVLVRDKFMPSGNCDRIYDSKEEAQQAIKQKGIGYLKYRVRPLSARERGKR